MDTYKQITVATLCTLACGAAVALGHSCPRQSHPRQSTSVAPRSATMNIEPQPLPGETPQQLAQREAHLWTIRGKIARLDKMAAAALDAGNYAEAESEARQSVSLGVESGRGQELLATALFEQGKDEEALHVYQAIADMGANSASNEFPYALLLLKAGRWAQAVAAYNTALTLGGDTDVLRQSTRFSPDVPQPRELEAAIRIGLGMTYPGAASWSGKRTEGTILANLQRALVLEPNSALANYYYGHALRKVGRKDEAKAAFAKAIQVGSNEVKKAAQREANL